MGTDNMSPTMELVHYKLEQATGTGLKDYIEGIRAGELPAKPGEDTWDDVAFWIRVTIGHRCVRETVRNWAGRLGIPLDRPADTENTDQEPAAV